MKSTRGSERKRLWILSPSDGYKVPVARPELGKMKNSSSQSAACHGGCRSVRLPAGPVFEVDLVAIELDNMPLSGVLTPLPTIHSTRLPWYPSSLFKHIVSVVRLRWVVLWGEGGKWEECTNEMLLVLRTICLKCACHLTIFVNPFCSHSTAGSRQCKATP
jgi:hypothetical protein